ncbi:hypothetical protein acdb102_16130 [Acidothermaceae bacterium B102]|nr:hypothetical protein acdb102_16130 [Acidothermaceae bacterium B102]
MPGPSRPPEFFLDRSLGGIQVPRLLRAAGMTLRTLAEVYGKPADRHVEDVDWLELAGTSGWPVLMKDAKIRYRPAERAALVRFGVTAFCLSSGNLLAAEMADQFISVLPQMVAASEREGPALYVITRTAIRRIPLDE